MTPSYRLASHMRACITDDLVIFLDLKADRYSALPRATLAGARIVDLPTLQSDQTAQSQGAALDRLRANGALLAAQAPMSTTAWRRPSGRFDPAWTWPASIDFVASCAWASHCLRRHRLDQAIDALVHGKASVASENDDDAAAQAIRAFERWRPLWPKRRVCLFDSLALCAFLIRRHVSCDLVFGVVGQPFGAHCWVECGGKGRVEAISETVLTPSEVLPPSPASTEPVYRVRVSIDETGREFALRSGMQLTGEILTERRSFLDWIAGPIFGERGG